MTRWRRVLLATAILTVCATLDAVVDHALIAPHDWGNSIAKGVMFLVVAAVGSIAFRLASRRR